MAETAPNGDRAVAIPNMAQPAMDDVITIGPILQADALSLTYYNRTGIPFRIVRVRSFETVVVATADSVVTIKNNGGETLGTLTIALAGAAVGDEDDSGAIDQYGTYSPIIADGEKFTLAIDGGASAGEAIFFVQVRPCLDGIS